MYDYLIVGSGIFGAVCARELTDAGKRCLLIEKKDHIGGACYSYRVDGIEVHKYGPHIFHTSDKHLWDYVNRFTPFRQFQLKVLSYANDEFYSLPINFQTIRALYPSVKSPQEAQDLLARERFDITDPRNLEEQALSLVGTRLYRTFIEGHTTKHWGKSPKELPASIIKRLPVRYIANDKYYRDTYEGMPDSWTALFVGLLNGIDVHLDTDYLQNRAMFNALAERVIYTGAIDAYFDYCYGPLEWRTLDFELQHYSQEYYQPSPLVTYPERRIPFTRSSEYKHFHPTDTPHTIVVREYPRAYEPSNNHRVAFPENGPALFGATPLYTTFYGANEPYYPIADPINNERYRRYRELVDTVPNLIVGGRLGNYVYADSHQVINMALTTVKKELENGRD